METADFYLVSYSAADGDVNYSRRQQGSLLLSPLRSTIHRLILLTTAIIVPTPVFLNILTNQQELLVVVQGRTTAVH